MCSLLWGRWIRWITRRGCRILDRKWELTRRGNGRAKDLRGRGRMRCWWTRRRRRGWKRFGRVWGFEKHKEKRGDLTPRPGRGKRRSQRKNAEGTEQRAEPAHGYENAEI